MPASDSNNRLMRRATWLAVAVASLLIAIKLVAYVLTGSVALLSSLIDSVVDLMASTVNLLAVHVALQPPDREHRFGHGKAEPLAGLAQAAFISGSGVFVLIEAFNRLWHPQPLDYAQVGIGVMILATLVTIGLVIYQRRAINATGSLAITADSLHYYGDVLINVGVITAIAVDQWLGWHWFDPLIAIAIALYLLVNAWRIATGALDQLMDRELADSERERIKSIVLAHPQVHDLHELRTRASGLDQFIQLHLVLTPDMDLATAHAIATEVQQRLARAYPQADIIIHQDPADDSEASAKPG
ncbi:ferrous-iron efflux pump FieF [Methylohalomonas lacus]|uniref:Cation-efflux pump FieF n=1 Tax=Methylohalomonas lacus TaxID=398773 RepID=A0AAE3L205_9GAMM|nr:cation diffusion facilitator family transporter [Methylohalomonas lacus]MCS3903776.1 ferrous-iron efflux pump FieF [Methylohalomonas lacus]